MIAAGDGETFQVWDGKKSNETLTTEEYPNLMLAITKRYPQSEKQTGRTRRLGNYVDIEFYCTVGSGVAEGMAVSTKGTASTIPQIRETFDGMLAERGFCKGIIFDLNVQFATTQKPATNPGSRLFRWFRTKARTMF